ITASATLFMTTPVGGVTPDPRSTVPNITGSDPNLAPLADNGGPTFTHAITRASAAFDKGDNPLGLTPDQRLFARRDRPASVPAPPGVDIGAFNLDDDLQVLKTDNLPQEEKVPAGTTIHYTLLVSNFTDSSIVGGGPNGHFT